MLIALHAKCFIALIWIFASNVYSQSSDCGTVNTVLQTTNEEGAWPWMVAITKKVRRNYDFWCNGFLIDRRHALTAAHCFADKYKFTDFLIRIGKKNWKEGEAYKVTCISKHPRFNSSYYYDDIAILTLSRNVDTSNYVPICIPDDNLRKQRLYGEEVTKTAWGALELGGHIRETLIQNTGLRIIPISDCNQIFTNLLRNQLLRQFPGGVSFDMVCAENPTNQTESCGGDGGSPLMYRDKSNKWIAVGVTSYGYNCGVAPTGFIKVSAYLEWIIENTVDDKDGCNSWEVIFESEHNPR